jgi:hypothetical protein
MVLAIDHEAPGQFLMMMGLLGAGLCDALYFLIFTLC